MLWRRSLEAQDRVHGGVFEPREMVEGEKQLVAVEQQPEAVLRMFVTSTVEVPVPGISDLLLVIFDQL
jgi:hypothetical protein